MRWEWFNCSMEQCYLHLRWYSLSLAFQTPQNSVSRPCQGHSGGRQGQFVVWSCELQNSWWGEINMMRYLEMRGFIIWLYGLIHKGRASDGRAPKVVLGCTSVFSALYIFILLWFEVTHLNSAFVTIPSPFLSNTLNAVQIWWNDVCMIFVKNYFLIGKLECVRLGWFKFAHKVKILLVGGEWKLPFLDWLMRGNVASYVIANDHLYDRIDLTH